MGVGAGFPFCARAAAANWPGFRGPGGRGVADGFSTPAFWNADESSGKLSGILWRADIPGLGHSSPVIWNERLFVATAVRLSGKASLRIGAFGDPTAANDNDAQKWMLLCFDKRTGKLLWEQTPRTGKPRTERHEKSSHANSTLATDGKRLAAFFGSEGLYCFDMDGKLIWSKDLGVINISKYGIGWGYGSSPALYQDRIVVLCDDPGRPFLAAFRLADGKELWRVSRTGICERSWGTPLIHASASRTQIVTNGWPFIVSYDLETGRELWRLRGGGDNPIPTPFAAGQWIVVTNSHGGKSPLMAIRPEAKGDISLAEGATRNDGVAWSQPNGGSYISTPVVYGEYVYLANTNGVIRCFEFSTGRKMYEERAAADAVFSASLVAADGKVYCSAEQGDIYVLKAGPAFEVMARNKMGAPCLATPAISGGALYFRTASNLIAVG